MKEEERAALAETVRDAVQFLEGIEVSGASVLRMAKVQTWLLNLHSAIEKEATVETTPA